MSEHTDWYRNEISRLRSALYFIANAPMGYGRVKLGNYAQRVLKDSIASQPPTVTTEEK